MNIETKYSIGDEVWYLHDNKIKSGIVIGILITIGEDEPNKKYIYQEPRYSLLSKIGGFRNYTDNLLFKSKEELLKSL